MHNDQKETTHNSQTLIAPNLKNADMQYPVEVWAGTSNSPNKVSENPFQNPTVIISPVNKLWKVHTGETNIGKEFILKSTAVTAAIKYVATRPEGSFSQIKIKGSLGNNYIYWDLGVDEFPPQRKPAGLSNTAKQ